MAESSENGSIEGRVHPAHDHAFVLSTAHLPDLNLRTPILEDGSFRFENIRPGVYLVEVKVPSLGSSVEAVEVRPGEVTRVEIELKAGSHTDEIVVTGSADARSPLDLASPASSLSGVELDRVLAPSLGETLAEEPGISSTYFGPGSSRPVIRGLSGDRVSMLEGGIGTGDASGVSADHAVSSDPARAERIEVLRGPATLLYGSSAIGGVVNVIDERIPSTRATGDVHGQLDLRAGTVSDERSVSVGLDGGEGAWAWHADALVREADDVEIPGYAHRDAVDENDHEEDGHEEDGHEEDGHEEEAFGFIPNTDLDTRGGRVGGTYFFGDRGFVGMSLGTFATEYGLPGGLGHGHGEDGEEVEADEGHGDVPVRIDMQQTRLDVSSRIHQPFRGVDALRIRLGATDYEHVELEGDEEGTLFFNDSWELRVEAVQARKGGRGGSFGVQLSARDLEAIGAEAFLPPTTTERWAAFALQELEIGPVLWQVGARYERQTADPSAGSGRPSRSHDGVSSSVGWVWRLGDVLSLGGSLARSVKLPAVEELYSDGPHIASQSFEIGDDTLGEEVALGLDLSLRWESERAEGELTLFRQDFDGFIYQAFTGGVDDGLPVVLSSQADAEFQGAELEARFEIWGRDEHHLHLRLMGDLVDAELDSGENLPRIPPLRFGAGLHYHSEIWNASLETRWIDDQTDVAPSETSTDGYSMVHASVGYRMLAANRIIDLMLRGRNLTNEEARSHTSFLKDVAPLPGRDLSFSVRVQF